MMRLAQLRTVGLALVLAALAAAGWAAAAGPPAADPPRPEPATSAPAQPPPPPAPIPPAPRVLAVAKEGAVQVQAVQFSPDGSVVAVTGARLKGMAVEGIVNLWDAATGRLRYTLRGDDAGLDVVFAPDGKTFASSSREPGAVFLREVATGRSVRRFDHDLVSFAAFSPDGRHLVSESNEGVGDMLINEVKVWDVATGKMVYSPARAKDEVVWPADFAAGARIVIGSSLNVLRVADLATGRETALRIAGEGVANGVVARDGKSFLLRLDGRLRLTELETGKTLREYGTQDAKMRNLGMSPDGTRVLGGTALARVTVWDAATGVEKASFGAAGPKVDGAGAGFTPDGRYVTACWSEPAADGDDPTPWAAVFTADGRLVRKDRGVRDLVFDPAMRSVAVVSGRVNRKPDDSDSPDAVTIHDAATWLAGPAKKD